MGIAAQDKSIHCRIKAVGSALPDRIVTSSELETMYGLEKGWALRRTGVRERRIADSHESASSLATDASVNALTQGGLDRKEIECVIVATATADMIAPSTAAMVANNLGLSGIPTFDISCACAGWLYGAYIARSMISSGAADNVLVIGSEVMSRIIDWKDNDTRFLFGDGAAATVLGRAESAGFLSITPSSDGSKGGVLFATNAIRGQNRDFKYPTLVLDNGLEVFRLAVNVLSRSLKQEMEANGLTARDIDGLVLHQANARIIDGITAKLGVPEDKVVKTIDIHGNTSAASVPLALDTALRQGKAKHGDKLLFGAFGSGLTWCTAAVCL